MTRVEEWMSLFAGLGLLWYECRQDFAIFCYRIGCKVLAAAHRRASQLAPVSQAAGRNILRNNAACLIPSFTSSAPFTAQRDLKS